MVPREATGIKKRAARVGDPLMKSFLMNESVSGA
jgi:hypothetical protein